MIINNTLRVEEGGEISQDEHDGAVEWILLNLFGLLVQDSHHDIDMVLGSDDAMDMVGATAEHHHGLFFVVEDVGNLDTHNILRDPIPHKEIGALALLIETIFRLKLAIVEP